MTVTETTMQEFTAEHDNSLVYGKIAFPEGEGPWPVIIFSHGFSACRVYDSGMEREFVNRGFAFAAFDFCSGVPGSRSSGTSKEMSVLTEAADLEAVINRVCEMDRIDRAHVFLLGSSQGGYVSTLVASERPDDIAGLALFFPAFNIGDDTRARVAAHGGVVPEEMQIGRLVIGRRYHDDALSVNIFERIGAYPGEVLIVHGALDEIVPVAYSQRAAQTFQGLCKLEIIEELGHGFRTSPPAVRDRALGLAADFFTSRLLSSGRVVNS